jgi:WhiB family redox-sensing transcriptional regulator
MAADVNAVPDPAHRVPCAGRFDSEATRLLARRPSVSVLGGPRQRAAGLPAPNRTRPGRALPCQVHDPDLWFADAPADIERAKALCRDCPAQLACLAGAIERREPTGVWGGQILDKGGIVTHKRPRGRPRKGSTTPQRYPLTASLAPNACPDVEGAA